MDEQPTRTRRVLTSYPVRLLLVAVVVGGGIAVINRSGVREHYNPPPITSAPARVPGQIQPGVWIVGTDVQPGIYRSTGPAQGASYCMWSRHSSAAGGLMDDIIASDGGKPGHQMIVTIAPSDVLFRTNHCAPFEKVG